MGNVGAFGAGWQVQPTACGAGKSKASFKVVENGAQKSKGALQIEGEVDASLPYAWAGAIFFPGEMPMSPADLPRRNRLVFGPGRRTDLQRHALCAQQVLRADYPDFRLSRAEWKHFTFKLAQFDGYDGHDLAGLFIGAGLPAGKFALQIDDVRFQ